MTEFLTTLVTNLSKAPILYLSGVAFTAASFMTMRGLVSRCKVASQWAFIILALINGAVLTAVPSINPDVDYVNPGIWVAVIPVVTVVEFAFLTRDKFTTYIFFLGMFMLQFTCIFGFASSFITSLPNFGIEIEIGTMHLSSFTLTMLSLSLSLALFTLAISKNHVNNIIKHLIHNVTTGHMLFIYMISNGIVLGATLAMDYQVYFNQGSINDLKGSILLGMNLRYGLIFTISYFLLFAFCKSEINRKNAEVYRKKASTDPLTGLLNRSGMDVKMEDFIAKAASEVDMKGALFIVDLDEFKTINDTFGHPEGDKLLVTVSESLHSIFRDNDYVCRLGGDEFCIFMSGEISLDIIKSKAEAINERLRIAYKSDSGKVINTSASVGIALFPEHADDYASLYRDADQALYKSKSGGKDRYTICSK